jgi:chorismate mutase
MKNNEKQFYLVDFQVLPEAIKKTIRIKESLKNGRVKTINEALSAMNISRSAYYKYKDHVEAVKERSITYFIMMQNDFSLLNKIMRKIKKENNDVLSINSGVAFGENVPTIISFKTKMTLADINLLAESIRRIKGIIRIVVSEEEGSR